MVVFESEGIGVPGGKDTTTRARRIADHKGGGHLRGQEGGRFEEIAVTKFSFLQTYNRWSCGANRITNDRTFFQVA